MVEIVHTIINSMILLIRDYENKYYIKIERILILYFNIKTTFSIILWTMVEIILTIINSWHSTCEN